MSYEPIGKPTNLAAQMFILLEEVKATVNHRHNNPDLVSRINALLDMVGTHEEAERICRGSVRRALIEVSGGVIQNVEMAPHMQITVVDYNDGVTPDDVVFSNGDPAQPVVYESGDEGTFTDHGNTILSECIEHFNKLKQEARDRHNPDKPEGLYLRLFHGRENLADNLDDWGFDGPVIGPLTGVHTTYMNDIKFDFVALGDAKYYPELNDKGGFLLEAEKDCVKYGNDFYGDWEVHYHKEGE